MTRHYEDSETRRQQVAEAALRTISEEGVGHFTTRAIAERVGISDGTLFRHFGNKEEIVLEALSLLEREMEVGFVSTGDPLEELEAFFRHRAAFVGSQISVGRLIFSNGLVHLAGEEGRQRIRGWRQRNFDYLVERLSELRTRGLVRCDVDARALAMIVQGTLLTFAMKASSARSEPTAELHAQIDHTWGTLHTLLFV